MGRTVENKLHLPTAWLRRRLAVLKRPLIVLVGLLLMAGLFLSSYLAASPVGYFDSTTILGHHDVEDVVEFAYGVVTYRTCCGQETAGRFEHRADGTWLWHYEGPHKKNPFRKTLVITPGVFSLACRDPEKPEKTWQLRRRLTAPDHERIWANRDQPKEITTWAVLWAVLWGDK